MRALRRRRRGRTGCASAGIVALDGIDTRSLVLRLRDAGRDARRRRLGRDDAPVEDALEQVRAQPAMEGQALVAQVSTRRAVRLRRERHAARRASSTTATKRSILRRLAGAGAAVTVVPHTTSADELAGYDGVRALERPRRPRAARDEVADRARAPRPTSRPRHLPRPPAARPRDRARDVQAPVRPPRREPPGARARDAAACSSRARTTASRSSRPTSGGGDARLALRRHRRGLRLPRAARALGAVPPRGGPGAARRLADPRALGRGARARCRARARHRVDLRDRLRADRDRPGVRVRLRGLPGAEGAARGRASARSSSTRTRRRS